MQRLSDEQFKETFGVPMRRLPQDAEPPFDFWPYFESIPTEDFAGYTCKGDVDYVWEHPSGTIQHVLVNSQDKNVFMVLVLNLDSRSVTGHHPVNLNKLYGLDEA